MEGLILALARNGGPEGLMLCAIVGMWLRIKGLEKGITKVQENEKSFTKREICDLKHDQTNEKLDSIKGDVRTLFQKFDESTNRLMDLIKNGK